MRTVCIIGALLCLGALLNAQPTISDGGIVNAATFTAPLAPGQLVSIFGTGLTSTTQFASTTTLSNNVANVSITINNIPAPIKDVIFHNYTTAGGEPGDQINAEVPWSVVAEGATQNVNVIVTRNGVASAPKTVQIVPQAPALFSLGGKQAIAYNNNDFAFAAPSGSIGAPFSSHPATAGDPLVIYATGLGITTEAPPRDGADSLDVLRHTKVTPVVLVGGQRANVIFSGLQPQFPGVNQINITVPSGVTPGDAVPLQLQVGGITTPNTVTIAIR